MKNNTPTRVLVLAGDRVERACGLGGGGVGEGGEEGDERRGERDTPAVQRGAGQNVLDDHGVSRSVYTSPRALVTGAGQRLDRG